MDNSLWRSSMATIKTTEKSHRRLSLIIGIFRVFSGTQHEIDEFRERVIKELEDKFFVKVTSVLDEEQSSNGQISIVFSIHVFEDFFGTEDKFKEFEREKIRTTEKKFGGKVIDIFYKTLPPDSQLFFSHPNLGSKQ